MKNKLKQDYLRRQRYNTNELELLILKVIAYNKILPIQERKNYQKQLNIKSQTLDSRITRIKNRCLMTGRSKGIIKKYKISRIAFKQLANQGLIPGIRKSSW